MNAVESERDQERFPGRPEFWCSLTEGVEQAACQWCVHHYVRRGGRLGQCRVNPPVPCYWSGEQGWQWPTIQDPIDGYCSQFSYNAKRNGAV